MLSKPADPGSESAQEVPLDKLRPNPFQPRQTFSQEALEELKDSIQAHGILQPVVVRTTPDGYEIIAGERRCRAARLAGLSAVPAVVRDDITDQQLLELALVENVQRQDLGPLEKAQGYRALQEQLGLTQAQVAERVGLQRSSVANHLRLLELPEPIQEALGQQLLTMGHARALLGLSDPKAQLDLLARIGREDLSVRAVERIVRAAQGTETPTATKSVPRAPADPAPAWTQELQRRFEEHLGTRVRVTSDASYRGQIVIDFFERKNLDRLIEALAPSSPLQ
ncbi:MAG: ParB/RepB/Spo0J family partition protein [Planctomycetota bacterium]